MRKSQVLIVAAVLLLGGVLLMRHSSAQQADVTAGPTSVAVCDIETIFRNYARATELLDRLNEERVRIKNEYEQRGQAVQALELELGALKEGSEEYEARLQEIQRLGIESNTYLQFSESLIRRKHHHLTEEMYHEILAGIAQMAQEREIDLVVYRDEQVAQGSKDAMELLTQIRNRKVLYSREGLDITQAVLERLNQAYRAAQP